MEVAVGCSLSTTTGASLREAIQWHSINWAKANRTVRRLQVRIVQAIEIVASFIGRLNGLSLPR